MAVSVANIGPLRKNSMSSSGTKGNEAKLQPNYPRYSIGSCHDLCKFGRKRDLTVKTMINVSEKPASSPIKGRKPDKSNNMQKKNVLLRSSGSPSTVRSPISQVRGWEIQPGTKKLATTGNSPRTLKMKPLERIGASKLGGRNIETNASKQTGNPKARRKAILVPVTGSPSHKARKVLKEVSHPKRKNNAAENELESPSVDEKILFITEFNPENQLGFMEGENVCDDSLQSKKQITQASSLTLLEKTEDGSCIDKEVDLVEYSPSSSPKGSIGSRSHEGDYTSSSLVSLLSSASAVGEVDCSSQLREVYIYHDSDGDENDQVKVVLRHQNIDEKRPTEVSINYVIEETVKELAKKRKGAVKALVGAFETVISLQDLSFLEQLSSDVLPKLPIPSISPADINRGKGL